MTVGASAPSAPASTAAASLPRRAALRVVLAAMIFAAILTVVHGRSGPSWIAASSPPAPRPRISHSRTQFNDIRRCQGFCVAYVVCYIARMLSPSLPKLIRADRRRVRVRQFVRSFATVAHWLRSDGTLERQAAPHRCVYARCSGRVDSGEVAGLPGQALTQLDDDDTGTKCLLPTAVHRAYLRTT